MSEKGQVIKAQSQRNCPLHSKYPLNLYWFWVMQHFQTSVHCPSNCSLFFILPLASQAAFIMASPTYAPLLVYLNAISKHPPLHFLLLYFPSILFVDITTFPQYPVRQDYLYLKYAEMKVEALGVCFVIEVPHATPWIPIARLWCSLLDSNSSSRACCCSSSKVRRSPLRTAHSLRGYAYLALVYHHFCQLPLLCKQALIFIGASSSLSTVLNHIVTRAQGIVLQRAAYDCRATYGFLDQISLPAPLHATLAQRGSALHKKAAY